MNDFVEINFGLLLEYEDINEAKFVITEFKLCDNNSNQLYIANYNNNDNISYINIVYINKTIFYNFEKPIDNLNIVVSFRMTQTEIIKLWYKPNNLDHLIVKHYGK